MLPDNNNSIDEDGDGDVGFLCNKRRGLPVTEFCLSNYRSHRTVVRSLLDAVRPSGTVYQRPLIIAL